jgi:two-component system, LytTR family, response regulator
MGTAEMVIAGGRLPLKQTGRIVFVALEDIEYVEASGNYVRVHAGGEEYVVREKLSGFEDRLPSSDFVRIHRSVIVNRHSIHELRRLFTGSYVVTLNSGKQLTLSRRYRQQLQSLQRLVQ